MGSDEEKTKHKRRRQRNMFAKELADRKYRQRRVSKDYKKLKSDLANEDDNEGGGI